MIKRIVLFLLVFIGLVYLIDWIHCQLVAPENILKCSKEKVLSHRIFEDIKCDLFGCTSYGDKVAYLYITNTEVTNDKGEDLSRRTHNSKSYKTEGKIRTKFYIGSQFYRDTVNDKWYETAIGTTTIEAYNIQMKASLLKSIFTKTAYALTKYADAGGDGVAWEFDSSWANTRGGAGEGHTDNCAVDDCDGARSSPAPTYRVYRPFFPFDTSSLPDNATITAASLNIRGTSTLRTASVDLGIGVILTTQTDPTSLETADFNNLTLDNPDEGATRINVDSWDPAGWNVFTFNATGLGWISKTGWTKLGLREGHDIDNTTPDGHSIIKSNYSDYTGTSRDPYLDITYTVPEGVQPQILILE